jgi:hypothetical protein
MSEMFRPCPSCGSDRAFAQFHAEPGPCPDAADGDCPEWFCTDCGTALMIGGLPVGPVSAALPASLKPRARVA